MRLWLDTGRCLMGAMRAQRRRDLASLYRSITDPDERARFQAWLWWGWSPWPRVAALGVPGLDVPLLG